MSDFGIPPRYEAMAVPLGEPDHYPPGTIVVLANEAARYSQFYVALSGLAIPEGSVMLWRLGSDVAEARNSGCAAMEGEWVWFIDDDHDFPPDTLLRLLQRNVDIVTPSCLRRDAPFLPIAAEGASFLDLRAHGKRDLVEVVHAGSSGMLIRRRVLDKLDQPYFELGDREDDGNRVSEDVTFCRKAREAGFQIHVDLAAPIGHFVVGSIWPVWNDDHDRWMTTVKIANGGATLWIEAAELP